MTTTELLEHCTEENSLSYNELKEMSQEELDKVYSLCWKDPDYNGGYNEQTLRCSAIGIRDFAYNQLINVLDWSDDDGDNNISYHNPNQKIHQIGDGTWQYGVYKSVEQVKSENRDKKIKQLLN